MGIKITGPKNFKIDFKVPTNDPRFWDAIAQDVATEIHKRTQKGLDVDDRPFNPYSKPYAKAKATGKLKGHGARGFGGVNLTLSGKMLGALSPGARGRRDRAQIILSGNEGGKAYANEKRGREFVGLSNRRLKKIFKKIDRWINRKNKL